MLEAHPVFLAVAPDDEFEPFRQRVDDRDAHAVEAARNLVGIVVAGVLELAARVQLGHDDLGGGYAFFLVEIDRNAAPVILDRYGPVGVQLDQDEVAMARQRFVDRIVRNFEHHVVEARSIVGIADIHARPLSHRVEALEDLDRIGAVLAVAFRGIGSLGCAVFRRRWGVLVHIQHIGA